jgi:eukaryotic-like serine/threonine-protein kinase
MSQPTTDLTEQPPPDPDLAVGQTVGEYVVDGKLGQGAFGSVFRAVHPLIGKVVAIKVLARRFSVDPDMVSRFQAEARAVNQIRHRNIIDIFSFLQLEDGRHYYVMEYLDGETLDARIARDGRLELADALPILRAIARALDAAHAKGIAHRDLKAENIFLARDPDGGVWPKLLDFGIAKLLAPDDGLKHKTRTGTPVGTPYYMSPEQCRGRDVDHRTDLYALGVLAYLMLTGVYPLDGDDYMTILMRQMADHPVPPSIAVPELPRGVDDAIAWLMKKDPADRPSHARAAIEALEAAAVEAGIAVPATQTWDVPAGPSGAVAVARAQTPPALTRPPVKRSRAWWLLALPVVAAAGVAFWFFGVDHGSDPVALAPTQIAPAPTPTLTPTSTPTPEPAPAPAPSPTVIVDISGVPEGTEVLVAGSTVGAAPGPVQLPKGGEEVVLTFKLDGYLPVSKALVPDRDQQLAVTLKRKLGLSRPGAPKPHTKDDIIDDVFDKKAK